VAAVGGTLESDTARRIPRERSHRSHPPRPRPGDPPGHCVPPARREIGRILRQILERRLYLELGFESFEDYVVERLDLSPRTARRLVRLARAPEAVATAFREGRITLLAAEAILRGAPHDETVTLRTLQEQVRPELDFWAPPDIAGLFLACERGGGSQPVASAPATEGRNLRAEGGQGCAGVGSARSVMESHAVPLSLPTSTSSAAAQRAEGERSKPDGTTSEASTGRG
jgi:hypothetical protein